MKFSNRAVAATALLLAASAASAHAGHEAHGFAVGLAHPLDGFDHLLAMVAVGLWSAAALPASRRLIGLALFMLALSAGAAAGAAGFGLAGGLVETGIAASVAVFGLMLVVPRQLPAAVGFGLVAAGASLHGVAHGAEMPAGASFTGYAVGFLATTAALHLAGLGLGGALLRWRDRAAAWAWRLLGAGVGVAGLALLAARF